MRASWLLVMAFACGSEDKSQPAKAGSAAAPSEAAATRAGAATIAQAPPPAAKPVPELPPPPAQLDEPAGPAGPPPEVVVPKKVKIKDIVQPVKIEKRDVDPPAEPYDPYEDDEDGEEGGVVGGVVGGDVGGVVGAPPPPPPPPAPPQNVAPTVLEGNRVSGDKNITPDEDTRREIGRSGKGRIIGSFKLCITSDGNIASVNQLKSTGFPAYDAKIVREIRQWRYRPFLINGKASPVCTAVTFIYSQQAAPPAP